MASFEKKKGSVEPTNVLLLVSDIDGFDLANIEYFQIEHVRIAATKGDLMGLGVFELELSGLAFGAEELQLDCGLSAGAKALTRLHDNSVFDKLAFSYLL